MFIELTMHATQKKILVAYDMISSLEPHTDSTTIRAGSLYAVVNEHYTFIEEKIEELKQKEKSKWPTGTNESSRQKRKLS